MTGIYCYHNTINGKRYIGQAVDLIRRKRDHYNRAFNNFESNTEYNSAIHQAFRKYGYENFEYSILEECDVSELNSREIYWITFYDSKNNGYNCDNGGSEKHFCKLNQDILDSIYRDLTETSLTFDEIRLKNNVSIGFVSDFNNVMITMSLYHKDYTKSDSAMRFKSVSDNTSVITGVARAICSFTIASTFAISSAVIAEK